MTALFENVAEALDEDVSRAEHISQLSDLLRVLYRLIERVVEVVGNEDRKVRVLTFKLFV